MLQAASIAGVEFKQLQFVLHRAARIGAQQVLHQPGRAWVGVGAARGLQHLQIARNGGGDIGLFLALCPVLQGENAALCLAAGLRFVPAQGIEAYARVRVDGVKGFVFLREVV